MFDISAALRLESSNTAVDDCSFGSLTGPIQFPSAVIIDERCGSTRRKTTVIPLTDCGEGKALIIHTLPREEVVRLVVYAVAAFFTAQSAARRIRRVLWEAADKGGEHWAERARLFFPVREELSLLLAVIPAGWIVVFWVLAPDEGPRLGAWFSLALVPLPAVVLVRLLAQSKSIALERSVRPSEIVLHHFGAFYFSIFPHVMVLGGTELLVWLDPRWWWPGTAAMAALGVLFLWRGRIAAGRFLLGINSAPQDIQTLVDEQTHRLNLPAVKAFTTSLPTLSVRSLPLSRQIVFSEYLIEALNSAELAALSALELDRTKVRRSLLFVITTLTMAVGPSLRMVVLGGLLDWRVALAVVGFFFFLLVFGAQAIQRGRRPPDSTAIAELVGSANASSDYATALEKIHRLSGVPAHVGPASGRQPSLYDRMLAVDVKPSFDRPGLPDDGPLKRLRWTLAMTLVIAALLAEFIASVVANVI
ncbi:MAG: hypothetical protein AAF654_11935 [Myxococcota bacterium]